MGFMAEDCNGTWKIIKISDNYHDLMKKLGKTTETVKRWTQKEIPIKVTLSGNKLTINFDNVENIYTLGEEYEEPGQVDGTTRKVIVTMEGDDIKWMYPNYDGKGMAVTDTRQWIDSNNFHYVLEIHGQETAWVDWTKI